MTHMPTPELTYTPREMYRWLALSKNNLEGLKKSKNPIPTYLQNVPQEQILDRYMIAKFEKGTHLYIIGIRLAQNKIRLTTYNRVSKQIQDTILTEFKRSGTVAKLGVTICDVVKERQEKDLFIKSLADVAELKSMAANTKRVLQELLTYKPK